MFSRGVFYLFISFLLGFLRTLVVEKAADELREAYALKKEKNRKNTTQSES